MEEKSILVNKEIHKKLKEYSLKSGVKIKALVEASITSYLRRMIITEEEEDNGTSRS
tara:strand:- start:618 stop:788 length:171 start_codon:yes stop_codon:yes gene_type:complete